MHTELLYLQARENACLAYPKQASTAAIHRARAASYDAGASELVFVVGNGRCTNELDDLFKDKGYTHRIVRCNVSDNQTTDAGCYLASTYPFYRYAYTAFSHGVGGYIRVIIDQQTYVFAHYSPEAQEAQQQELNALETPDHVIEFVLARSDSDAEEQDETAGEQSKLNPF